MKKIKMLQKSGLTFRDGCEKYLDDCRQRNLREGTIGHYKQSYTQFYKVISPDLPLEDSTEKIYKDYVKFLVETLHNDVSINSYLRDMITTMKRKEYLMNFVRFSMRKFDKENKRRRKMKKVFIVLVILVMILGLFGCSSAPAEEVKAEENETINEIPICQDAIVQDVMNSILTNCLESSAITNAKIVITQEGENYDGENQKLKESFDLLGGKYFCVISVEFTKGDKTLKDDVIFVKDEEDSVTQLCFSEDSEFQSAMTPKSSIKDIEDLQDETADWMKEQAEGKDYSYDDGGEYYCMGKNDTCPNKTSNAYDLYCSSCDPDGDNNEG